jgi:bifunctional ADP-heptose synthase (sugar kinase/adenylyltransferase)
MNLLLVGDTCKDIFHYGKCDRICPEAPVPVFVNTRTVENAGMAGNVYNNLKSLGVETVDFIYNNEQITKTRYIDEKSNQMIIRVDENDKVNTSFDRLNFSVDYKNYDATVISDYNKGFITYKSIKHLSNNSKLTFVDTKKIINKEYFSDVTFVKINQVEWEFCKANGVNLEDWEENLIITLGSRGCKYKDVIYPVDTSIEVRDVSGAGDTWLSSFVVNFVKTNRVEESIKYANKNATIVVQKKGVSVI